MAGFKQGEKVVRCLDREQQVDLDAPDGKRRFGDGPPDLDIVAPYLGKLRPVGVPVGAVIFDGANEIKLRILQTGHATNFARLQ